MARGPSRKPPSALPAAFDVAERLLTQEAMAPLIVAFTRGNQEDVRAAVLVIVARSVVEFGVCADDILLVAKRANEVRRARAEAEAPRTKKKRTP